ncbi:extracellular solute-binding protein [Corynebacterium uterequi]|uniref:ABC-type sugar transport system, periplasmic component n=1 Tax=Corynebacterium uterequi TaxID=1072256 RepID=A0A0G3HKK7_9CORY|nr:extracellular solute-binding protein [Corynebacterium uterequi]AKK11637.1 ABC-type sugar transport system, periplasmic component [Corynebacterium uterequi]
MSSPCTTSRIAALIAAVGISATGLVACGNDGGTETNADGEIVVNFWHSSSGAAGETLQGLVDEFNKSHEGQIEVTASYQGNYGDAISKFIASVQTGDLPAILQASDVQTAYLHDSGIAVPAYELAEKDGSYDFEQLLPLVKNYYSFEDKVYSMPAMVSQPALYVNNDLLAEAGVNKDSLGTVQGLIDAATTIKDKTGKAGLTFHHSGWYVEQSNAMLGELHCTPENGTTAEQARSFNLTNDALVDTWQQFGAMFASGALHNPGTDSAAATGAFQAEEAAMQMNSSGGYGNLAGADLGFDWSILPLPRSTDSAGAVPGGNSLWAIKEGHSEEVQQAAWEFMKFIGSDAAQQKIFTETGYLPTTRSALAGLTDVTPQQQALLDQLATTPVSTVTAGCKSGALNDARNSYQTAMTDIANGADAARALDAAQVSADQSVASYIERAGA